MPKDKREFEYLTQDSMEIITRGEGISFEPNSDTIDRINVLASTESSKLLCPSFTKTKSKRKQGRPRKQLTDICEGVLEVGNLQQYETVTDVDRAIFATPAKHPTPTSPGPTLGELLQSAPILGKKRAREIEAHVSKDIFAEEIAASFVNKRETDINNLVTMETDGGIRYHFFHKYTDGTRGDEPIYTACLNYRDLKYEGSEMFSFAAQTSIKKALVLYPEAALKSLKKLTACWTGRSGKAYCTTT